jgi:hypothetical protein
MGNNIQSKNTIRSGYIYSFRPNGDICLIEDSYEYVPPNWKEHTHKILILTGNERGVRKWVTKRYLIQGRPCDLESKKHYRIDELSYHCKKIESLK